MQTTKERRIRDLALFGGCRADDVRWIAQHADEVDLEAGRTLAWDGDTAREFVVLIDGVCSVRDDDDDEVLLGPGSYYGEVGLMAGDRQRGTLTTRTPARVLVFGVAAFRGLIHRAPAVRQVLLRDLGARVREADHEVARLRAVS